MSRKRGGLGSGLAALIPGGDSGGVREVAIDAVRPNPRQPRTQFDETALAELAESIREHGIIQPLIVTSTDEGDFELIAGERRLRAARLAGLSHVPVLVKEASDQQLLELALVENVQRADLNALEEAQAYQTLKDQFNLSDEQIARRVGKNSRVTITNTRRLLALPTPAQQALLRGLISAGHGRAILRLDLEVDQLFALEAILSGALSVREAEQLAEIGANLAAELRSDFFTGRLSPAQALALRNLPPEQQFEAASAVIQHQLSVEETERLVALAAQDDLPQALASLRAPQHPPERPVAPYTTDLLHEPRAQAEDSASQSIEDAELLRQLERSLGVRVQLRRNASGGGQLLLSFADEEILQALYDRLIGAT